MVMQSTGKDNHFEIHLVSYELTQHSFDNLKKENIPNVILSALEAVKDIVFERKESDIEKVNRYGGIFILIRDLKNMELEIALTHKTIRLYEV